MLLNCALLMERLSVLKTEELAFIWEKDMRCLLTTYTFMVGKIMLRA